MIGTLPIQHYVSVALNNHAKDIKRIVPGIDNKPMRINFL